MDGAHDPFRVLSLSYDAGANDVRTAFRHLARRTHPDRGGSAQAFHEVRTAYQALTDDLEGQRRRWQAAQAPRARTSRFAAGLAPAAYPTCTVRITRTRDGARRLTYLTDRRPRDWTPGTEPPPGGRRVVHVEPTETTPAFGVWTVPLDAHRFRCVLGP